MEFGWIQYHRYPEEYRMTNTKLPRSWVFQAKLKVSTITSIMKMMVILFLMIWGLKCTNSVWHLVSLNSTAIITLENLMSNKKSDMILSSKALAKEWLLEQ